jgi:hypothetical protein
VRLYGACIADPDLPVDGGHPVQGGDARRRRDRLESARVTSDPFLTRIAGEKNLPVAVSDCVTLRGNVFGPRCGWPQW